MNTTTSPRAGVDEQLSASSEPGGPMGQPLILLAHELRSPIGAIRNAISVMESASKLPEVMEQARCLIARQVSHLSVLVEDVLDLAKRCSLPAAARPPARIVR